MTETNHRPDREVQAAQSGGREGSGGSPAGTQQSTGRDLVARLRDVAPGHGKLRLEAADEIERLRAALRQIAQAEGLGLLSLRDVAKETLAND